MNAYFTDPTVIWVTRILATTIFYWVPAALIVAFVKEGLSIILAPAQN